MNITEKIALDCGLKISKPFIDTFFVPLKNKNYIILDTRTRFQFGEYDYFEDVLSLVRKKLKEKGIEIFQFANENSQKFEVDKIFIKINKKQESFLIKGSALVICNENYSSYISSVFNKKCITLYSVSNPQTSSPVWNRDSQIPIESHRDGNLPTYGALSEKPKTINFISPFVIAKNILDSLGIENDYHKYEIVNIGDSYNQKIIEIVPDFYSDNDFLQNKQVNLRLDYVSSLSLSIFNYWLLNRKANIITDKDINISLIAPNKNNIALITIILSPNISENFLKQCKALGVRTKIFCNSEAELNTYRFKFLDWEIEKDFNKEKKLSNFKNLNSNSKFKSSKIIISKGKQFSCKASFFANKPLDANDENVIISPLFEEELEFFKIYNEH